MLLEALEILQNSGTDVEALVTDLGIYKVVQILTVYLPLATATFLLSQEFIGEKIACFPPSNFSDHHADPLQEYCWNEGRWISSELARERTGIYTQPHRYYPLYLPLQAILFLTPIIIWNILTKCKLLAALKGTEEFLDDLLEAVTKGTGAEVKRKSIILIKQFHETCVSTAKNLNLAAIGCWRLGYETLLLLGAVYMQFRLYNRNPKTYHCWIPELTDEEISCTVPILDMLDTLWKINVGALLTSTIITAYMSYKMYIMHTDEFQPLFYNNLPYGDEDEFNEEIKWETLWIKHSYRLLIKIFVENNQIMTRAVVLQALQPDERKRGWKLRLQAKKAKFSRHQRRAFSPTMSPRSMSPGSLTPKYDVQPAWPKEKSDKKPSKSNAELTSDGKQMETSKEELKSIQEDFRGPTSEFPNISDSGVDSGPSLIKDVMPKDADTNPTITNTETGQSSETGTIKEEMQERATLLENEDQIKVSDPVLDSGDIVEEENDQERNEGNYTTETVQDLSEVRNEESTSELSLMNVSEVDASINKAETDDRGDYTTGESEYLVAREVDDTVNLEISIQEPASPTFVSSFRMSLSPCSLTAIRFNIAENSAKAATDDTKQDIVSESNDRETSRSENMSQIRGETTAIDNDQPFSPAVMNDFPEATPKQGASDTEVTDNNMDKSSDSDLLAEYEQIPSDENGKDVTQGDPAL